jgi:hypothetical protein
MKGILSMVTCDFLNLDSAAPSSVVVQFPRDLADWVGTDLLWLKCGVLSRELAEEDARFQSCLRRDAAKSRGLIQLLPYFYARGIYRSEEIERRLAGSQSRYGVVNPAFDLTAVDIRFFRRENRELLMTILQRLFCFSLENRWEECSVGWREQAEEEGVGRVNTARHVDAQR